MNVLEHACPECNGDVDPATYRCQRCGLRMARAIKFLIHRRQLMRDVDAFLDTIDDDDESDLTDHEHAVAGDLLRRSFDLHAEFAALAYT